MPDPDRIFLPQTPQVRAESSPRNGNGDLLPTLETRERDREVYRLRIHVGLTFHEIAERLGYADPSGPAYAFKRVIDAIPKKVSEEARDAAIAHLESLRARLLAMLDEKYYTVQQGSVVFDPITQTPLRDRGPVLAAIDRLVNLEMSIAKLQGLLTSASTAVTVNTSQVNYVIEGVDMEKLR